MPHTCEVEGCGRTYQRKEHLNRHKKDHDESKSFECLACGAKFSRGDTLRRHMNLHGPRAEGPLPARVAKACVNCHRSKTRCDGREPTCSPCADKSRECAYPTRDAGAGDGDDDFRRVEQSFAHGPLEGTVPAPVVSNHHVSMEVMDVDVDMDAGPGPSAGIMDVGMLGHMNMNMDMNSNNINQNNHNSIHHEAATSHIPNNNGQSLAALGDYAHFIPLPHDLEEQPQQQPEPQPQPSSQLSPPPLSPPSAVQDPRNQQLIDTYFAWFHPQWPFLHRETFMSTHQPELLIRAVLIIGLYLQESKETRKIAMGHHDKLLSEAQDKISILSKKAGQNLLPSPSAALLPHLQGILLALAIAPYRRDRSLDVVRAMTPILAEVLAAVGAHDQHRIDDAAVNSPPPSPSDLDDGQLPRVRSPWLLRESYQRLALLHYKLHLVASSVFIGLFPWSPLDVSLIPDMLCVRVPFGRDWWERIPITWDRPLSIVDSPSDDNFVLVSSIVARAKSNGTTEALLPLFAWDRDFALAVGCWCTRPEGDRDDQLVSRLKPYLLNASKIGHDDTHVLRFGP